MTEGSCLIYGAYGYTGELIAHEAARRGLRPTLAGRRSEPLGKIARHLGLTYRVCELGNSTGLRHLLQDVRAVLHCAGPFIHTSPAMVDACLATGTHYLDITGEIQVFETVFSYHTAARDSRVVLLPGVGMDVVPTDCLAAYLAEQLPDATQLELALTATGGGVSRGTLRSMIQGLPHIGAERVDGEIRPRPPAFDSREIPFPTGRQWAMAIPWGDLSTAFRTTGIPNIRVYLGTPRRQIQQVRRLEPLLGLLGQRSIKAALGRMVSLRSRGPSAEQRGSAKTAFWGAVQNNGGEIRKAMLEGPEGYSLTSVTAVECLRRVLAGEVDPGAWTPATAFGTDFIKSFPDVSTSW